MDATHVPQTTSNTTNAAEIVARLRAGKRWSLPPPETALDRDLHALAAELEGIARRRLEQLVSMSVIGSNASVAVANMTRGLRESMSQTSSVAAASDELVASVAEITRVASTAAEEAAAARREAEASRANALETSGTMRRIATSVGSTQTAVQTLSQGSKEIGVIVDQIEAVARQTNLLALNATIEAARAGDAGRGFGVVASEVKELARQTARATEDIRKRIKALQKEMDQISASMAETARVVEQGREIIDGASAGIERMSGQVVHVSERIGEVSTILEQQSTAVGEVSGAITRISEMASTNLEQVKDVTRVLDEMDPVVDQAVRDASSEEIGCFTAHVAKSDHVRWKKRLAGMLAGSIVVEASQLADHHHCRLGKWYDSIRDPEVRGRPAFRALLAPHERIHAAGVRAARAYAAGRFDEAASGVEDAALASVDVLRGLDELIAGGCGAS
ncbi:methyl-accepting chemotaxis protein [Myxococcota bacterium]|nr:methyl-accepting chemotaxis protein [Myxococcota bacterium]